MRISRRQVSSVLTICPNLNLFCYRTVLLGSISVAQPTWPWIQDSTSPRTTERLLLGDIEAHCGIWIWIVLANESSSCLFHQPNFKRVSVRLNLIRTSSPPQRKITSLPTCRIARTLGDGSSVPTDYMRWRKRLCVFPEGPIDVMGGCRHSGKEAGIQSRGEQHKDGLILSDPFKSINRHSL